MKTISKYICLLVLQISTCSGFAAIHLANLKGIRGHRTSGVGGVCCARQDCWRPNGMGDLQKGERYVTMSLTLIRTLTSPSTDIAIWITYFYPLWSEPQS